MRAASVRTRGSTATYRRHPQRPRPPSEAPPRAARVTAGLPRSPQTAPVLRQAGVPRPERGPPLLPAPLSLHPAAAGRRQTSSRPLRRGLHFPHPRLTLAGGRARGSRRCCEQEARRGGSAPLPSRREPSRSAPVGKWGRPAGCLCGSRPSTRSNALRFQSRGQAARTRVSAAFPGAGSGGDSPARGRPEGCGEPAKWSPRHAQTLGHLSEAWPLVFCQKSDFGESGYTFYIYIYLRIYLLSISSQPAHCPYSIPFLRCFVAL